MQSSICAVNYRCLQICCQYTVKSASTQRTQVNLDLDLEAFFSVPHCGNLTVFISTYCSLYVAPVFFKSVLVVPVCSYYVFLVPFLFVVRFRKDSLAWGRDGYLASCGHTQQCTEKRQFLVAPRVEFDPAIPFYGVLKTLWYKWSAFGVEMGGKGWLIFWRP
jgi:hypothetical protein